MRPRCERDSSRTETCFSGCGTGCGAQPDPHPSLPQLVRRRLAPLRCERRPPRRRRSRTLQGRRTLNARRPLQSGNAEPVQSGPSLRRAWLRRQIWLLRLARAGRQAGLRRQIGSRRLSCTWRQAGLIWQAGALRLSGARRRTGSRRGARLLLSLAVRRARRLLLTGAVTGLLLLSGTIWLTGLQLSGPDLVPAHHSA